jgi:SAM-dependent methyltransferase
MTMTTNQPESAHVERVAGMLFEAGLATVELVNVALGLRLGLYAALSEGPATSGDLAARGGIGERYAREWLEQQAAAGMLAVDSVGADAAERRYSLPAPHRHVLLEKDSDACMGPLVESAVMAATWLPLLEPAYRTGAGVSYAEFGVHDVQAAFSRPVFANHLVQTWLPALPDVHAKLVAGVARVIDIGCGEGLAAVTIARSFPGVHVDGIDLDDSSIAAARRHAVEQGVRDRVRFEVADAATDVSAVAAPGSYDLVVCFEMLHDVSDPVAVLAAMRRLRAPEGAVLVVDERVAERFTLPVDPIERLLYSFSTLHCLPAGLAQQPSAATGTVIRPAVVRRYAARAGFTSVHQLPVEHPQFRLYLLGG